MEEELASEYARLLDRGEVVRLFARLEKETSRSEAARICGLGRRTTYDWDTIGEPTYRTKKRVLEALFVRQYEETLECLLEKGHKVSRDIIRHLLRRLYGQAIEDEIQRSAFEKLLRKFDEVVVKFSGLVKGAVAEEMEGMRMNLRNRAVKLQVEMNPLPLSTMSPEEVISTMSAISRVRFPSQANRRVLSRLSSELWLPEEILRTTLEMRTGVILKTPFLLMPTINDESQKEADFPLVQLPESDRNSSYQNILSDMNDAPPVPFIV